MGSRKVASFVKHDSGKLRWSLVPWGAMRELVRCLMHGAEKYGDENWVRCEEPKRYWDAAQRHLIAWQEGETHDPESGLNHLAHAGVSILFLLALTSKEDALQEITRLSEEMGGYEDLG